MVQNKTKETRSRGRPQLRCDDETRAVILEVGTRQFLENTFASVSMTAIADAAGVSTKTIYRLFPAKDDLFSSIAEDRMSKFFLELDMAALATMSLEDGLVRLLTAYGTLTMSADTIAITRLVIGESDRFPQLATTFYKTAIQRTNAIMEEWLLAQCRNGRMKLEDPHVASGMLRGMMIMEPQRTAMLRQGDPPNSREIAERAKVCARLFLHGAATAAQ